jgi:hypothetical protein
MDHGEAVGRTVRKRVASLKPSPENVQLYRRPADDPDLSKLEASVRKSGLREPLVITADNFIVSGHRRYEVLVRIGQEQCPCRVLPVRRGDLTADQYLALLRDYNQQRNKSVAEQVREELVDIDPAQAHARLRARRRQSVYAPEDNGVAEVTIEGVMRRYNISAVKADHVKYVKKVVFEDRRDFWPLSVRGVHYALLNYEFWRNTLLELPYRNDDNSYDATSDLITRLRLDGVIPWGAFDDPTRPVKEFHGFEDVRQFIRQELDNLFGGYWRDYQQSQPNHVEVVCEKNSIYPTVLRVTKPYQIVTSSGRGFNSSDAWHDLAGRYWDGGKERLIVIVLSDYDPEGERIVQVCGTTLRDDFHVPEHDLTVIKAGVTREQIERHHLPPMNFAKESSSNFAWFVARNDGDDTVWELEALDPKVLMDDLDEVIRGVIDVELFNGEVEREQEEAAHLEATRRAVREALRGLDV